MENNTLIIKDPNLIKHFFRREDELHCLSLTNDDVVTEHHIPITLTKHLSRLDLLLDSSNNIACLKATNGNFLIYNTLTGDSFVVDDAPLRKRSSWWLSYGFGYDPHDDDYKIVVDLPTKHLSMLGWKVDHEKDRAKGKYSLFYVYSLRNRDWKSFEADLPSVACNWDDLWTRGHSYSFNGVLHWVVCKKTKPLTDRQNKLVASLDLHTLRFSEMGLPTAGKFKWDPPVKLSELDGELCCCVYTATFDVWVMKEYGVQDSWTKLITIDRVRIMREYPVQQSPLCDPCYYGYGVKSCVVRRCREDGKFVVFFCYEFMVKVFKLSLMSARIRLKCCMRRIGGTEGHYAGGRGASRNALADDFL